MKKDKHELVDVLMLGTPSYLGVLCPPYIRLRCHVTATVNFNSAKSTNLGKFQSVLDGPDS